MQPVQVAHRIQDENAGQMGPSLNKESSVQSCMQTTSTVKSARKALGNITNTKLADLSNAAATKRRAFEDVTNSISKAKVSQKHSQSVSEQGIIPKPAGHRITENQPDYTAGQTRFSEDIERAAGKTYGQLELERELEEDALIHRSVQSIVAGLATWPWIPHQVIMAVGRVAVYDVVLNMHGQGPTS